MAKVKPIKAAVIGLGRAGWNIHVNRMRGRPEFQITAVADRVQDRLDEAAAEFGCETYPDRDSLLKNADAELVVVATQSVDHAPDTIAALKSGRHVVVEKPMAVSVAEAKRMAAAATKTGNKLFVHQNYRYNGDVRFIMDTVREKTVGNVFEIRCRVLAFSRRNDWQTLTKYGGGVLNNTGPHFVDAGLQMLGAPVVEQFTDMKLVSDAGDAEDHCKLIVKGANGRVYDMLISTSCAFPEPKWTVLGSCGTIVCDGSKAQIKRFDPKKVKKLKVDERPPAARNYGNDDVLPWEEFEVDAVGKDIGDYYDNVVGVLRKRKKQYVTPEQVVEVMRVIDKAHKTNPVESRWK
jgi:predicted dehydrogenase